MSRTNHPTPMHLLPSGLLAAPIAAFSVSLLHAAACCIALLLTAVPTVLLSALIPKKIPFAVRIVLYSVIGSLVYMPAAVLTANLIPDIAGGIYIPLLCMPLYLTLYRDELFPRGKMFFALLRNLIPVCIFALAAGVVRELLGSGTLWGMKLLSAPPLPLLLEPSGGLILFVVGLIVLSACRKETANADRF